jgi:hypothetical protein
MVSEKKRLKLALVTGASIAVTRMEKEKISGDEAIRRVSAEADRILEEMEKDD